MRNRIIFRNFHRAFIIYLHFGEVHHKIINPNHKFTTSFKCCFISASLTTLKIIVLTALATNQEKQTTNAH